MSLTIRYGTSADSYSTATYDTLADLKSAVNNTYWSSPYIKIIGTCGTSETDLSDMFSECENSTIDLSEFNTSNVTNMHGMFNYCSTLTSLNLSNLNTSNVTNMSNMFASCYILPNLDLSSFDTSNVTNMSYMFSSCHTLATIDLSSFNTSNVTNMGHMFSHCKALNTLDLFNFDTSNVTDMSNMFGNCIALITIYVSDSFVTTSVTNDSGMFTGSTQLVGAISYDSTKVDKTYANYTTGYFSLKSSLCPKTYVGVDGQAKTVKSIYIGVDGVARKVIAAYVGVDNIARSLGSDFALSDKTNTELYAYTNEQLAEHINGI